MCTVQVKEPTLGLAERVQGVASLYSNENIFLPTVSPKVRGGEQGPGGGGEGASTCAI